MASITDLRQKRAALWEKTKKFLDNAKRENDMLSAEDVETYEKMESEIVALGKEIDILERQAEMEKRLILRLIHPFLKHLKRTVIQKQAEQVTNISRHFGSL